MAALEGNSNSVPIAAVNLERAVLFPTITAVDGAQSPASLAATAELHEDKIVVTKRFTNGGTLNCGFTWTVVEFY